MRKLLLIPLALCALAVAPATADAGLVAAWGGNGHYNLCTGYKSQFGSTVPVPTLIPNATETVTGGEWLGALTEAGAVWTCGGNEQGQAANGAKAAYKATPGPVPGLPPVDQLAGSGEHMGALAAGQPYVWGSNFAGQECDGREGKTVPAFRPELLRYADGTLVTTAAQVAIGGADTYVLLRDGTVWGCGENHKGQLGDGTTVNKSRLVQVQGLTGIVSLAANGFAAVGEHLLAVTSSGTIVGLGLNDKGQLGNGTTANATHPVPAAKGLTGVVRVAAGPEHDLAVTADGTVYSWGEGANGQLGYVATTACGGGGVNGRTVCSLVPQKVPGLGAAGAIAAGTHFSLVAVAGRPYSFGQNRYGTLGDGTLVDHTTPTLAAGGLEGVTWLAGGYFNGDAVTTTRVTPEVSVVPGAHSLTLNWVSTLSHEPWHVTIRPVTVPVSKFAKVIALAPGARSYTFTGLAAGAYEVAVDSKGFTRKIATGVVLAVAVRPARSAVCRCPSAGLARPRFVLRASCVLVDGAAWRRLTGSTRGVCHA